MFVFLQTAKWIALDQTVLRPASVRTEHNAIDAAAAAAACTAGSDSPVRKVQKWLMTYLPSSLDAHGQQVPSFADSGARAEATFWLSLWNKSKWLVSVLTAFTYYVWSELQRRHLLWCHLCCDWIWMLCVCWAGLFVCAPSGGPLRLTYSSSGGDSHHDNSL